MLVQLVYSDDNVELVDSRCSNSLLLGNTHLTKTSLLQIIAEIVAIQIKQRNNRKRHFVFDIKTLNIFDTDHINLFPEHCEK